VRGVARRSWMIPAEAGGVRVRGLAPWTPCWAPLSLSKVVPLWLVMEGGVRKKK
jgi:hypothetical protein